MGTVWLALFGLLLVIVVRRHGWEYVPLVIFLGVGRWYVSGMAIGVTADGLSIVAFAGLWVVTGRT